MISEQGQIESYHHAGLCTSQVYTCNNLYIDVHLYNNYLYALEACRYS